MTGHPANLLLRWFLDLAALAAAGLWGWHSAGGWQRPLIAVLLPLAMVAALGLFAPGGDPIRSGYAPVPVAGWVRLLLEVTVLALACLALADLGFRRASLIFGVATLVHFALDARRVGWLLRRRAGAG